MTLVGYWPLSEDSGNALDYSGTENQGTVDSVTQGADGIINTTSYDFNETGHVRVDSSYLTNVHNAGEVSYCFWFYYDGVDGTLLHRGTSSGYDDWSGCQYEPRISTSDSDLSGCSNTGNFANYSPNTGWNHLVITISESQNWAAAHLNGEEVSGKSISQIESDSDQSFVLSTGFNWFLIGASHGGNNDYGSYNERISEVRIYNRALTPPEIQYLYQVSQQGYALTEEL